MDAPIRLTYWAFEKDNPGIDRTYRICDKFLKFWKTDSFYLILA
nr:hypothetical protein [Mycoplasmopsis bovis]